jgi:hypothetical protein
MEPDAVLWASVAAIEASFSVGDQWVGPGGAVNGHLQRYENVGLFIRSGSPVRMPHVSMSRIGGIRFIDGRHRFGWVRDHGAEAIPVTAAPELAATLSERFGSAIRECRVMRSL